MVQLSFLRLTRQLMPEGGSQTELIKEVFFASENKPEHFCFGMPRIKLEGWRVLKMQCALYS